MTCDKNEQNELCPNLIQWPCSIRTLYLGEILGEPVRVLCGTCGRIVRVNKLQREGDVAKGHTLLVEDHVFFREDGPVDIEMIYIHRDDAMLCMKHASLLEAKERN